MAQKKSIIKKTIEIGSSTLLSRFLGIIREILTVRYLGAGAVSDAFITAFKIPNSLRKIFAEGALSAALVPSLVALVKKDRHAVNKLMALSFVLFEGIVLLLCFLTIIFAKQVILVVAPGFSADQIAYAVPFLQILMPFIFFISSSALLAGALQAVHHFFVPAFSPVLLNIVFIAGLIVCLTFNLPVSVLCYFIIFGGFLQLIFHIITYRKLKFAFESFDIATWRTCKHVLWKFLPCLASMSVSEVSLFIDTSFASFLPKGSVSLIYYGNRFMAIPLGVFAVALSTILLPHFSRVSLYAPKRLSFYLLESAKLVLWVTLPATLIMSFFADKIFFTMFYSSNFSLAQVFEARAILIAFLIGLFFLSLNKILMSIYYALHDTWIPALIAIIGTLINIGLNVVFMHYWHAVGLALATSISAIVQTIISILFLHTKFKFKIYALPFLQFLRNLLIQLTFVLMPAYLLYHLLLIIINIMPEQLRYFLLDSILFWAWVGPLVGLVAFSLYYIRRWHAFPLHMHFLD